MAEYRRHLFMYIALIQHFWIYLPAYLPLYQKLPIVIVLKLRSKLVLVENSGTTTKKYQREHPCTHTTKPCEYVE